MGFDKKIGRSEKAKPGCQKLQPRTREQRRHLHKNVQRKFLKSIKKVYDKRRQRKIATNNR